MHEFLGQIGFPSTAFGGVGLLYLYLGYWKIRYKIPSPHITNGNPRSAHIPGPGLLAFGVASLLLAFYAR